MHFLEGSVFYDVKQELKAEKVWDDRECGMWTHDLMMKRRTLYGWATTTVNWAKISCSYFIWCSLFQTDKRSGSEPLQDGDDESEKVESGLCATNSLSLHNLTNTSFFEMYLQVTGSSPRNPPIKHYKSYRKAAFWSITTINIILAMRSISYKLIQLL